MRANRISKILCGAVAVAVVGIGLAGDARGAVVYNAGADLLANERDGANANRPAVEATNPNPTVPNWSYGYRAAATGAMTPFANHFNDLGADLVSAGPLDGFRYDADPQNRTLPMVSVNTGAPANVTGTGGGGTLGTGEIAIHPNGADAGGFAAEQKVVVRFTATIPGNYGITAVWEDLNECCGNGGVGVDVGVVINGTSDFAQSIARESGAANPANLPSSTNYANPSVPLNAGDTVDFFVGTNGQLYGDATRFNATLTVVPEPSTLGLLGVGALSLLRRRRGRNRN